MASLSNLNRSTPGRMAEEIGVGEEIIWNWFILNPELNTCRSGRVLEKERAHACIHTHTYTHTQRDSGNEKEAETKTEWEREGDTLGDGKK